MNVNYSINDVYAVIMEWGNESKLLAKDDFGGSLDSLRGYVTACLEGRFTECSPFNIKVLGVVDECNEQGYDV